MFKKNPMVEICIDRKKRKKLHILQTGDDLKIDVYELKCEKPLILTVDINRIDLWVRKYNSILSKNFNLQKFFLDRK